MKKKRYIKKERSPWLSGFIRFWYDVENFNLKDIVSYDEVFTINIHLFINGALYFLPKSVKNDNFGHLLYD